MSLAKPPPLPVARARRVAPPPLPPPKGRAVEPLAVDTEEVVPIDGWEIEAIEEFEEREALGVASSPVPEVAHAGAKVIVVVEDDADMRGLLVAVFEDLYTVYAAKSGTEAIELFGRVTPSLVISDVRLPGADGYAVAEALKKRFGSRHVPLIFLTAHGTSQDVIRGINAGARHYLTKPISPPDLRARVDKILR